jgi:hypothetical protein
VIILQKLGKDPKFPHSLRPISLLSTAGKFFEKIILESKSVWLSYTSQHDASMQEAYGPRDPKLQ